MEKYYIPTIEEFHIGFEYETHEWSRDERGDPEQNYDKWVTYTVNQAKLEFIGKYGIRELRVKYLDRKDIESLGFHLDGDETYSPFADKYVREDKEHSNILYLFFNEENHHVLLAMNDYARAKMSDGDYKKVVLYRGIVKNLTQLKKVIKDTKYYQ